MQLIIFQNDRQVKRVKITANRSQSFIIGRADDCSLVLDGEGVNNYHASIHCLPDGSYHLLDDDSARGTLVNGKVISGHELTFGDKMTIGPFTLIAVCDHAANGKQINENQQTSKGGSTMTNLVKICMYLAFGILGGFSLFWGNIALVFLIIVPLVLWFYPHKIHWWGAIMMAVGHGITFYLMRGEGSGLLITTVSGFIYLVLLSWRQNEWKKNHSAAEFTNIKR